MEMIAMGPIGSLSNGSLPMKHKWDDKGHGVISHIIVSFNSCWVKSIQFCYVNNGALVLSKVYGSSSSVCNATIVRLKHDSEFVTGISAEVGTGGFISLTLHTNLRQHKVVVNSTVKPYGTEKMELHSGILERREFGGFFGTYDNNILISIGFYVLPVLPDVQRIKKENL